MYMMWQVMYQTVLNEQLDMRFKYFNQNLSNSGVHWTPQDPERFCLFLFTNMHSRPELILVNDYSIDSYKNITQRLKYLLRLSTHAHFFYFSVIQGVEAVPIFSYLLKFETNQGS